MPRSGEDRPAAPPAFAARPNQASLITPDNDRPVRHRHRKAGCRSAPMQWRNEHAQAGQEGL
jgi:hypothetical protein